jgi:hypothetical protein
MPNEVVPRNRIVDYGVANRYEGLLFCFRDRLFGTAHLDPDTTNIDLGLAQLRSGRWQTLAGLWKTPFMRLRSDGN